MSNWNNWANSIADRPGDGARLHDARLAASALAQALIAVTPSHRSSGCWCGQGRDIERDGHEPSCEQARKALAFYVKQEARP